MFLTAVILILFFSLSDLAKWMNQNGATDKQKLFVFGGIFVLIVVSLIYLPLQAHHKRGGQPLFFLYQTRGTYALRGFINLEKLCMLVCFDTESKNKSIKLYYISVLFYSKFIFSFILYVSRFSVPSA